MIGAEVRLKAHEIIAAGECRDSNCTGRGCSTNGRGTDDVRCQRWVENGKLGKSRAGVGPGGDDVAIREPGQRRVFGGRGG